MLRFLIRALLISLFTTTVSVVTLGYKLFAPEVSERPKVIFTTANYLDQVCPKKGITPEIEVEALIMAERLDAFWQREGKMLLDQTAKLMGRMFPAEIPITLSACPYYPSIAFPTTLISIAPYIPAAGQNVHAFYFIDSVYHEILHTFVLKTLLLNMSSPILEKYSHEPLMVRWHLHVYAVQREVYHAIGRKAYWDAVVKRAPSLLPHNARAIEIVEEIGSTPFIKEIQRIIKPN